MSQELVLKSIKKRKVWVRRKDLEGLGINKTNLLKNLKKLYNQGYLSRREFKEENHWGYEYKYKS